MNDAPISSAPKWDEQNSKTFIDLGRYYVPDREYQFEIICELIPARLNTFDILELCCGEGLLAQALLERYPQCNVLGLDGSHLMLEHARQALVSFGDRFNAAHIDLAANEWRNLDPKFLAIVSTLAIHHLDDLGKQLLFQDLYHMLQPGGALIISDVIQAASTSGKDLAANSWDEAVRQQALSFDGDLKVFDRFMEERWNMFRYRDDVDQPSR